MGVTGLLPFLKKCSRPVNIKDFEGYTVAVDTYCWIHRASHTCAMDLALGNPTTKYVTYCIKYIKMILDAGVRPILVFDGANLPAKSETDSKRHKSRKMYREKATQYLLEGNRKAAQECFEKCVEVTHRMALDVLKAARDLGVDCIVAPYESDAQLAYLVQAGYADFVITEDSDLLLFGCKQVLYKLDLSGNGILITWSAGIGEQCCGIPAQDFAPVHLRFLGILSGCDYFPGIPRIGLATAAKILRQCRTTDFRSLLSNIGSYCNLADVACQPIGYLLKDSSQSSVFSEDQISLSPSSSLSTQSSITSGSMGKCWKKLTSGNKLHEDTIRAALRAERTFRLQVVFDPKTRRRVRISEPTVEDINEERLIRVDADQPERDLFIFAGDDSVDSDLAFAIALGNADFDSGKISDTFNPDHFKVKKLFTGLRARSEPNMNALPGTVGSVLRMVRRPDGERLNISIWHASYKLEPVWLYYTDNGLRSRPFCISIEDSSELSDSQRLVLLHSKNNGKSSTILPPPPSTIIPTPRPRLSASAANISRGRRITVPSVLTAEPSVISVAHKRPASDAVDVQDVVTSYYVTDEDTPPPAKVPLRDFSSSETPIVSASAYFDTPVPTVFQSPDEGPKSPILECERPRFPLEIDSSRSAPSRNVNVFAAASSLKTRSAISERRSNFSLDQVKKPEMSPLSRRFSFTPLKNSKPANPSENEENAGQQLQNENDRPGSPIFDEVHVEPAQEKAKLVNRSQKLKKKASNTRTLITFFNQFQYNPHSKRNSTH